MRTTPRRAKATALLTTTALATLGLAAVAGSASAAPTDPNIEADAKGAIVITKLENPGGSLPRANGALVTNPNGTPLSGATFKVCKVSGATGSPGVTLAGTPYSYSWWEGAAGIASLFNPNDVSNLLYAGDTSANCTSGIETSATGKAIFDELDLGLYLVRETNTPAPDVEPAKPFLVTLPLLDESSPAQWFTNSGANADSSVTAKYIAFAYPKNPEESIDKTADTSATTSVGSPISYTVMATVPCEFQAAQAGPPPTTATCKITNLEVKDAITSPNAALDFNQTTLKVSVGTLISGVFTPSNLGSGQLYFAGPDLSGYQAVPSTNTGLTGTDYTLKWNASPSSGFTISFTPAGLAKLDSLAAGTTSLLTLKVEYAFKVGALLTTENGMGEDFDNGVTIKWNNDSTPVSDSETVHFGGAMVHKIDAKTGSVIPGVQFQVFKTADDTTPLLAVDAAGNTAAGNTFTTGQIWTSTTSTPTVVVQQDSPGGTYTRSGTTGETAMLGLSYDPTHPTCWVTGVDSNGGATVVLTEPDTGTKIPGTVYYVQELSAPAGYVTSDARTPICITGALDGQPVVSSGHNAGAYSQDDFVITNVPRNAGFPLPFTGDFENTWQLLVGFVIAAGAAIGFVFYTKKRAAQAA